MKTVLFAALACLTCAHGQLMISGNENKVDLTKGTPKFIPGAPPDSISILDFASFPPSVRHVTGVSNSVIGPPSNVAVAPDESIALVADSIQQDPADTSKYVPASRIYVLDLQSDPPSVIQEIEGGKQPSGLSITRDGRFALVANRAGGTVSLLSIEGKTVTLRQTIELCKPEDNVADVAISPDGKLALASVCNGGYLAMLHLHEGMVTSDKRKLSTCGKPYRVAITPDGTLGVTAGSGQGIPDTDAITVVDLTQEPPRTTDYIPIGGGPESLEVSPDGTLIAAVLIGGSNLPKGEPFHEDGGKLIILARRGKTFEVVQILATGPIPEGVAFTQDGKHIVVGCHPVRKLWVYDVDGETVRDSKVRIDVPGMPSSLRTAERPVAK
ncbi:MAG: YncE family protein [Candidatus Hydrogenedentes bacterium]|nr:YncE family protein [Candidatus Hydrogenedentota bacterium]